MQNKPNVKDAQINVNSYIKSKYEKLDTWLSGKNKPNSNPIKPNLRKAKMNVNLIFTKDYRKYDDFTVRKNKPNSNPISSNAKMSANAFSQKDYENETALRPQKNKPKQTQFQTAHLLMDSRKYKKYLTLPLGADRICCVPEIICCNRNNEKGFQSCL